MHKSTDIGAYETKTRLAEYLRKVQAGERFTITQRGRPVAELVPYGTAGRETRPEAARRMRAFMRRQSPATGIDIKALIDEGRD
ncbi:type II toxin-antitoxin system Phd/YefM family antitoxin [Salinisphaera sp. LB1]|uniref:type II toxin-antitoxin system Phd/YefM family antitoxin n=1 Tax=Salinisphaera sp. LB1 TaxID=2183911 RepID=UPI000D7052F3|nr:type II toxin-antitoxin system prevent-host-death family antitoxin [Salinisphaera sp. LB1]